MVTVEAVLLLVELVGEVGGVECCSDSPALDAVVDDLPAILNIDNNDDGDSDGGGDVWYCSCCSCCSCCCSWDERALVVGVADVLLESRCDDVVIVDGGGGAGAEDPKRASKPRRALLSI
jgi:hypothetical protein